MAYWMWKHWESVLFPVFEVRKQETAWKVSGISDWKHFVVKAEKHTRCEAHVECCLKLALLGQSNVAEQLSQAHREAVKKHNLEVDHNRLILSRMIECVKFCGAFELALRGHDEGPGSKNPGVFLGLVDFAASLDAALKQHLEKATVFKGTSKTIQNDLLDVMYAHIKDVIREEIKQAEFVAVMSDDTSDVANMLQNVVILRYIINGAVVERFWSFCNLQDGCADSIAERILDVLSDVLPTPDCKNKLIAQCYDGASVMRGGTHGVQTIVRQKFPHAHYIHCYAHQLNLVIQQALCGITRLRIFFSTLQGFTAFFSHSPKRVSVLDECVGRRLPRPAATRWNFSSRLVQTVSNNVEALKECFSFISQNWRGDQVAIREASGLLNCLKDPTFLTFLQFFNAIMPHIDILYAQMQKRDTDPLFISNALEEFLKMVTKIRCEVLQYVVQSGEQDKRCMMDQHELRRVMIEACDLIVSHCKSRFKFTNHLVAATLVDSSLFECYHETFPEDNLAITIAGYPFLSKAKLASELKVVYSRPEMRDCSGSIALLQLFCTLNLQDIFSETIKLLKILITTPMTTSEAERSFSTLRRVKTFLRSTMTQERLNALAVLSMEKALIHSIPNFNSAIVERFAHLKERRAKFLYKK